MQKPGTAPPNPPHYHVGQPGMAAGSLPHWGVQTGPQPNAGAMWASPQMNGGYGAPRQPGALVNMNSFASGYAATNMSMTKGMTTTMADTLSWDSYAAKCVPKDLLFCICYFLV
jgi:hypothetical protein